MPVKNLSMLVISISGCVVFVSVLDNIKLFYNNFKRFFKVLKKQGTVAVVSVSEFSH